MLAGLTRRFGGALAAPRETLCRVRDGQGGGFNDLLLLMTLQVLGLQLPKLAKAAWYAVDVSVVGGLQIALQVFARLMLPPLVVVIAGGVALRALDRGGHRRHLDMAAICAIPAIVLQLLFSLLAVYVHVLYQPLVRTLVLGSGVAWFVGLLLLAARPLLGARKERLSR